MGAGVQYALPTRATVTKGKQQSAVYVISPVSRADEGYPTLYQALLSSAVPAHEEDLPIRQFVSQSEASVALNTFHGLEIVPCMGTLCVTTDLAMQLGAVHRRAINSLTQVVVTMPYYVNTYSVGDFYNTEITSQLSRDGATPGEMIRHTARRCACNAPKERYCLLMPEFDDPAAREPDCVEIVMRPQGVRLHSTVGWLSRTHLSKRGLYRSGLWFATAAVMDLLRPYLDEALWHIRSVEDA